MAVRRCLNNLEAATILSGGLYNFHQTNVTGHRDQNAVRGRLKHEGNI